MRLSERVLRRTRDERGGTLVFVAAVLFVLFVFTAFVVDVGNWFEHKRHLQVQADAAALAAAGDFIPDAALCAANEATISNRVQEYGKDKNPQVGDTPVGNIFVLLNSPNYYNQSTPNDTELTGGPCSTGIIDVKATETSPPFFFKTFFPGFDYSNFYVNAQARVEILQANTQDQALPIAVPDPAPRSAYAVFVDESANPPTILAWNQLHSKGTQTLNGKSLTLWDDLTSARVPIDIKARTGVVFVLSGLPSVSITSTTQLSELCNRNLLECYQGAEDGPWKGVEFIHGYASSGGGGFPIVRNARLYSTSCTDGSAPYFVLNGNCVVGMEAEVDFGPVIDPLPAKAVAVPGPNCPGSGQPKGCALLKQSPPGGCSWDPSKTCWKTTNQLMTIPQGGGAIRLDVNWQAGTGAAKVSGTIPSVLGAFGADPDPVLSGPIEFAQVLDASGSVQANSVPTGMQDLPVAIGVLGNLENAKAVSDPIVKLRIVKTRSGNSSQTQAIDCDPALANLKEELATGCGPLYKINTGETCPNNQAALWATAQPWPCAAISTGAAVNQIAEGLNLRIFGVAKPTSCPPLGQNGHNNWSMWPSLPKGDMRIVQVFTTPFGSFTGSGNTTVAVQNFATFYITGYTGKGSGFDNPCEKDGDQWSDPKPNPGFIYGHFIKYVQPSSSGGGTTICDFTAFGNCVAVLTR